MLMKINPEQLNEAIASIGAHSASIPIFQAKAQILPIKLIDVRTPAANIIKQEMLGAGGDAVTHVATILNQEKYVDVLLLGTRKHYNILIKKLEVMQFFGMKKIAEELKALLNPAPLKTILADGRVLTYEKMQVMGILNITPDSFYEGSRIDLDQVVDVAGKMLEDGATILDIGGESTRPGSTPVSVEEEIARVIPAIEIIHKNFPQAILSIDTTKAQVARKALKAGAHIVNDISALEADSKMLSVVKEFQAPVIIMHGGLAKDLQTGNYKDVVGEVASYLYSRAKFLEEAGLSTDKIILDPGIGFGKNASENLKLMRDLESFTSFGYPVLLAASRKSCIGKVLGELPAEERLEGSLATSCQAVFAGVNIVRVHDVKENVRAIRMLEAIRCQEK